MVYIAVKELNDEEEENVKQCGVYRSSVFSAMVTGLSLLLYLLPGHILNIQ